jgi:small subunit ribosomal protein S2
MVSFDELLEAGVHFGHLARKWHPAMKPYIFTAKNDIHIIDLNKTQLLLDEAERAVRQIARSNRKVMFVGTKKQAREIIERFAKASNSPYVTDRWLGGMLTNFATVRKSVKKLQSMEKMELDGTAELLMKKERLMIGREKAKLTSVLGGVMDMSRLPGALFIVDVRREHLAVAEARKLSIPTIGIVDTNSDPNSVDFPIPANDDAAKSLEIIIRTINNAIIAGNSERRDDAVVDKENAPVAETVTVPEAPVVQEVAVATEPAEAAEVVAIAE